MDILIPKYLIEKIEKCVYECQILLVYHIFLLIVTTFILGTQKCRELVRKIGYRNFIIDNGYFWIVIYKCVGSSNFIKKIRNYISIL
eukprot:UN01054